MADIPSGFQLHSTSWENDGDNYSTQIQSGLTKADVQFSLEVAQRFSSTHDDKLPGWGNAGQDIDMLHEFVQETLAKHPGVSYDLRMKWSKSPYGTYNTLLEYILGRTSDYGDEDNFCRVFESYKVFFFPFAAQDVTNQF